MSERGERQPHMIHAVTTPDELASRIGECAIPNRRRECETLVRVALNRVYSERNLCAMLACALALELGCAVWAKYDVESPGWMIVYAELRTGQVSWHVPEEMGSTLGLVALLPPAQRGVTPDYDNHTTQEKYDRVAQAIRRALDTWRGDT